MKKEKSSYPNAKSSQETDATVWQGLGDGEESPAALTKDPQNRAIISLLQEDGRMSYAAIARQLGVSEGFVRHRVQRLMDARVFKVIAVADPMAMGFKSYAMIGIKVAPGADPGKLAAHFRDCPEAVYVLFTSGYFDLLVEVICETQQDFRSFLVEQCYAQGDVASVEPMMGLEMYKYLLKWSRPDSARGHTNAET